MSARPEPGTQMIIQWRKWDGSPHWRHETVYLGSDQWGDWIGQPVGWHSERPGMQYDSRAWTVRLLPASEDRTGEPATDHVVTVNRDHPHGLRVYIDLAWDVRWSDDDPLLVTGIDMDLDVVRVDGERPTAEGPSGTWVDDRDEWAEHSVEFGYPSDVMTRIEALTLELETRVRDKVAPFDDATPDAWIDRLIALAPRIAPRFGTSMSADAAHQS